jgi:dipeptidyl aminopeptidase/acylaminoacyl peptidase
VTRTPVERRLRARLRAAAPPRSADAERRAWHVVRAAHAARPPAASGRRGPRLALAAAVSALAACALALSPAGARVGDWIGDVVSPSPAPRSSLALPAPGRLLVLADGSTWTVAEDGARRRVGAFSDATWSPGGLFLAAARGRDLVALEPNGVVRWVRPTSGRVSAPRWSPDGYRIAYRSGSQLRVAVGDDSDDWLLAPSVDAVAPAWKPLGRPAEQVLAFASHGRLRVVEVDTRRSLGVTPPEPAPREIWWAEGGERLLTVSEHAVRVHGPGGALLRTIELPTITGSAVRPGGRELAVAVTRGSLSSLLLVTLGRSGPPRRVLESSRPFEGLAWSTDGSRILVGRPEADQWLFVPARDSSGLESVRGIRAKFGAGSFPLPAGWCYAEPANRSTNGQPPCLPGSAP